MRPEIKQLGICMIILGIFLSPVSSDSQEANYMTSIVLSMESSDKPENIMFGYTDSKKRMKLKGFEFFHRSPGPFFLNQNGDIYIYNGRGTLLKKYSKDGTYLNTLQIEDDCKRNVYRKGCFTDINGEVIIRSSKNKVIRYSTRGDKFTSVYMTLPEKSIVTGNKNGSFILVDRKENKREIINRDGISLGQIDYDYEDSRGNIYKIVGEESRIKGRSFFRKSLEVYACGKDERAWKTSDLALQHVITPGDVSRDIRWRLIGFDGDDNIYLEIQSKPDTVYSYGNPFIHVLKYDTSGKLVENIKAMIPCSIDNAPIRRFVNIDDYGVIYVSAIQPETAWNITKGEAFYDTDYGDVADMRFKIWKLVKM